MGERKRIKQKIVIDDEFSIENGVKNVSVGELYHNKKSEINLKEGQQSNLNSGECEAACAKNSTDIEIDQDSEHPDKAWKRLKQTVPDLKVLDDRNELLSSGDRNHFLRLV